MYSEDQSQRRMYEIAEMALTFSLPNVPLLYSVPSKICSSDSIANAGRLVDVDVLWAIFDTNCKVV